jgi:hypothetical protein
MDGGLQERSTKWNTSGEEGRIENGADRKMGCTGVEKRAGIRKGAGVAKEKTAIPPSGKSERSGERRGEWSALQSVGLINQSSKL